MLSVNLHPFPTIQTERLLLRKISKTDAVNLLRLRSDKNVMQYIGRPIAVTIDDALEIINIVNDQLIKNNGITWAITLRGTRDLIGTIGLWRIIKEHHRAEIGYLLDPKLHGKGLITEAMKPVLEYGFGNMKLHSVEAHVNPNNKASLRLLEKNNFIREAHFKENFYFNGKFLDSYIYSLITPFKK
jgi:ribosomal-protein-alanine N-acetyltransferase